ncbi:MAG: hypothetical protein RMI30_05710 [Thermodesulfovibrio sp.]|nr:hypothetical protein [Thermodesulfovibrio sp.]MDW7998932.1 hypothetical protein [Thermodesulfovibrio sp.]
MKKLKVFAMLFFIFCLYSFATAAEKRYNLPIEDSPFIGSKNAPITIIKFIDYQ